MTTRAATLAYENLVATLEKAHTQASILARGQSLDPHRRETLLRMTGHLYDMTQGAAETARALKRETEQPQ